MLGTLLLAIAIGVPAEPPAFVRFESGHHIGSVRGAARDPVSGDWVTVGLDKTIRRWREGRSAGPPLRLLSGSGHDGELASVAVSPQGLLAVGDSNRAGPSVWLIDLGKGEGQRVRRLRVPANDKASAFVSVAFSADGKLVAAGDNSGDVAVWNVTGGPVGKRRVAPGSSYSVFGLAFAPSGSVVAYAAAHNDGPRADDQKGYIGTFNAGDKALPDSAKCPPLPHRTLALDWSAPNAVLVGGSAGSLDLWKPGSASASALKTGLSDPRQEVDGVSRSADGKTIVAGTILGDLLVYEAGATEPRTIHPGSSDVRITALRLSPDGQTVLATQNDGTVVEASLNGGEPHILSSSTPTVESLRWSTDGKALSWKTGDGERGFSLARSEPGTPSTLADDDPHRLGSISVTLMGGRANVEGAPGWTRLNSLGGIVDAAVVDERHILVATSQGLNVQDANHTAPVMGEGRPMSLARSPDGTKVAVGFADGLVRIYPTKGLDVAWPLATLYVKGSDWVAWQEQTGLYDSSVGGDRAFGFQVNPPTEDQLASFVPAAVAEKEYRKPGLLPSLVGLGGPREAAPMVDLATAVVRAPAFRAVSVEGGSEIADGFVVMGNSAQVTVDVRNQTVGDKVAVRIGQGSARDVDISAFVDVPNPNGTTKICTVRGLVPGRNLARIFVNNKPIPGSEFVLESRQPGVTVPARTIVVAIGIVKYAEPAMNTLETPVADAKAFIETVQANSAGEKVVVLPPLFDEKATRTAILACFDALKAEAKPSDRVLVFMASHGVRNDKATYVTPTDFSRKRPDETGLAWTDLAQRLSEIDCRSLVLFTDNCHSGAALDGFSLKGRASAMSEMRELQNAVAVFAACDATQESQEYADLGHGLFTYALLQGLQGKLPGQGYDRESGIITVDSLREAVPRAMAKLKTDVIQTPRIISPDAAIPVTRVKGGQ